MTRTEEQKTKRRADDRRKREVCGDDVRLRDREYYQQNIVRKREIATAKYARRPVEYAAAKRAERQTEEGGRKYLEAMKRWRTANKQKIMWRSARDRALKHGLEFTIVPSDIVIPEKCPVFDTLLVFGDGKQGPNSPSLDRIIPAVGYTPNNIWVISFRANAIKQDATPDDLRRVADRTQNKIDDRRI